MGTLTNGLQLKVINYQNHDDQKTSFWSDFDGIIKCEKSDSFFTIYKIFSTIKGRKENLIPVLGKDSPNPAPRQYIRNPPSTNLPKVLQNILDVCEEVFVNGIDYGDACEIIAKRKNLAAYQTVRDACTRRIGVDTAKFRKLLENKPQLINHLSNCFPEYSDEIRKGIFRNVIISSSGKK